MQDKRIENNSITANPTTAPAPPSYEDGCLDSSNINVEIAIAIKTHVLQTHLKGKITDGINGNKIVISICDSI